MIEGRFDLHFLEVFAQAESRAGDGDHVPLGPLMIACVIVIAMGTAMAAFA